MDLRLGAFASDERSSVLPGMFAIGIRLGALQRIGGLRCYNPCEVGCLALDAGPGALPGMMVDALPRAGGIYAMVVRIRGLGPVCGRLFLK